MGQGPRQRIGRASEWRGPAADFVQLVHHRQCGGGGGAGARLVGEDVGRVAEHATPVGQVIVFVVLQGRVDGVNAPHQQDEGLVQFLHSAHQLLRCQ